MAMLLLIDAVTEQRTVWFMLQDSVLLSLRSVAVRHSVETSS